ncbi:Ni/Fe hydrogenase subunit alpha [Methanocaldococcus indicus]|uniref:Ni/Fe hydrogenase subunit alpha n=1 Tax=Methanocaldococcus indicus TaxID=213231 RepID=UPI003C6DAE18
MHLHIEPISRVEGHGKVEIILDENGKPKNVRLHITALRGFEQFVVGRPAEEVPRIVPRICGICQAPHHLASVKAVDNAWGVEIPDTAKKLRELMLLGNMIHSHALHFFFLCAPDFILGVDASPEIRNIVGLINENPELAKKAIALRRFGQRLVDVTGGKAIHPITGVPGGVSKRMKEEERDKLLKEIDTMIEYAKESVEVVKDITNKFMDKVKELGVIDTWYLGILNEGKHTFYDGTLRFLSPDGKEKVEFKPEEYLDYIGEHVVKHSYVKYPYYKKVGYPDGIYRVGPLAMLNVCDEMETELAEEYRKEFFETFEFPVKESLAYHYARMIELVEACEKAKILLEDNDITSDNIKVDVEPKAGVGVGVVEAPRGVLIHNYETDENGIVVKANMIVASTHNVPPMEQAIIQAVEKILNE